MSTDAVSRQQRLVVRARRQITERITAGERAAHDRRVAANQRRHGHGQELADRMHASAPLGDDITGRPGWRTFLLAAVISAAFLAAVQGAPHNGSWNVPLLFGGAVVVGLLVWSVRFAITGRRHQSLLADRELAAELSPMIGCGVADCGWEPCTTYRRRSEPAAAPIPAGWGAPSLLPAGPTGGGSHPAALSALGEPRAETDCDPFE
jgi:hypothetical protein